MLREGMPIGHYQIIQFLGSGSMGEVYLAQDTRIARKVAIKVVKDEVESYPQAGTIRDDVRLFEREMKAITTLDHPNILPLYDFGKENIQHSILTYMIMPFRPEGSLADWLNSQQLKTLPLEERFPSIMEFAHALAQTQPKEEASSSIPITLEVGERSLPSTVYVAPGTVKQSKKSNRALFMAKSLIFFAMLMIGGGAIFFIRGASVSSGTKISSKPTNSTTTPVSTTIPPTMTAMSNSYYQLKPLYTGTASGYASATITFTLVSEDKLGNVSMTVTFQRTDDPSKFARYACNGTLTIDNKLHLSCRDASFLVTIDGFIYADGHIEGTWLTTEDNNPSYNHFYNWSVS